MAGGLDGDIELLAGVPLFADLSKDHLRLLAFSVGHTDLAPGMVLFREGEAAASGYVIASGALELSRGGGEGRRVLETCGPGSLVGEMALFIDTKRPATATATAVTTVIELGRPLMLRMLNEYPDVAKRIGARFADRVRATVTDLQRVQETLVRLGR